MRADRYEAVEDLAADDVRLAELRSSPHFLCEPHGLDWDTAMGAIVRGVERASAVAVAVGLIAIASRNYGIGSAERTMDSALRHRTGSSRSTSPGTSRRTRRRSTWT